MKTKKGSATEAAEMMRQEKDRLEDEVARLEGYKESIEAAHKLLDKVGIPGAAGAPCDYPKCISHMTHRVHTLIEREATSNLQVADLEKSAAEIEADHQKCVERLELQLAEARAALFYEAKGVACGESCASGGYRGCGGCSERVKRALGLKVTQSIYDADPRDKSNDSRSCVSLPCGCDGSGITQKGNRCPVHFPKSND